MINALCSCYEYTSLDLLSTSGANNKVAVSATKNVYVRDVAYTDPDALKTALNGIQFVYDLATPQTYQLTPQEVTTLIGENTVWADTGDVSVTAYGEPILTAQANTLLGVGLLNNAAVTEPESDSVEEPTEEADEQE
jgi:hypothetical protein